MMARSYLPVMAMMPLPSPVRSLAPRPLPMRMPRVCVAIVGEDGPELIQKAETIARDNPFLEFRLDYLRQPAAALGRLNQFLVAHPEILAVATCRRAANGGKFRGSLASQIEVLTKAAKAGFQLVDVELESAESLKAGVFDKLHSHAANVLSFHDF